MKIFKNESGSTLVEIVVALAMVSVVLVTVAVAGTVSVKSVRLARERAEAKTIAETIIEEIRQERDTDPETFFSLADVQVRVLEARGTSADFVPTVRYTPLGGSSGIDVRVEVDWNSGGKAYQVSELTQFSQWQ